MKGKYVMEEEKEYMIEEALENADNKEFMLQALKDKAAWVIAYASDKLFADKELMLEGVKQDGQLLYYASEELRDDKDIVLSAVANKGIILKYASKRLRGDKEVGLTAIKQDKNSEIYLTDELREDTEIKKFFDQQGQSLLVEKFNLKEQTISPID